MNTEPSKPRLLIIDDEPLLVNMITRILRREYEVTTATSALDGLRLATNEPWDAILCDVMLPDLTGPQLLLRLQSEGNDAVHRMGFMTGGAFGDEATAFIDRLGHGGWLAKPFSMTELSTFVARLVGRSAPNDTSTSTDSGS